MKVKADRKIGKWKYWGVLAETALDTPTAESLTEGALPVDALLRRGDRGEDVKALQRALRGLGYDLEIDGIFGRITLECVKSFQATHGLVRDGIVGPLTWAALEQAVKGGADNE
jgi:peptidoglycan hydrolase-like protein with peptidoglycan-binding domain